MPNDRIRISALPAATTPSDADVLAGVQSGTTKKFSLATIKSWLQSVFVPLTRTINNKALSADITLGASDIGAQPTVAANGILKGDGAGGVSAAVGGTDYQAPLTAGTDYATPAQLEAKANQAQLAYVETGSTASRAYAVGEYFCWNGLLYRATAAISSGGTFTPGTNCETTTVMSATTANWTPTNATTPNASRNYYLHAGKILMVAVCLQLSSSLNSNAEREVLSNVSSSFGITVNPNQMVMNMGIAYQSAGNDIPIRIIYNNNKLLIRNQSGTTVDTSRIIYGQIVLGIQ